MVFNGRDQVKFLRLLSHGCFMSHSRLTKWTAILGVTQHFLLSQVDTPYLESGKTLGLWSTKTQLFWPGII